MERKGYFLSNLMERIKNNGTIEEDKKVTKFESTYTKGTADGWYEIDIKILPATVYWHEHNISLQAYIYVYVLYLH